ncbi:hypothetical protein ACFWMS_14050 [Peribacillus butanolivorans]|uniref:hypothetical protein n=1 Tax=Peribacillus butanolivorans TaxID=421767 RepID=UPI00365ADC5F
MQRELINCRTKEVKRSLKTNIQVGVIATIPHIATSNAMDYWSPLTYRMSRRRLHAILL